MGIEVVDPFNDVDFLRGPRHENDAIGLKAFSLAILYQTLWLPMLVDELATEPIARNAALTKTNLASLQCPTKTLVDSSRLYSPAIARLIFFNMVALRLPSFSNSSAQYCTEIPAFRQMNS